MRKSRGLKTFHEKFRFHRSVLLLLFLHPVEWPYCLCRCCPTRSCMRCSKDWRCRPSLPLVRSANTTISVRLEAHTSRRHAKSFTRRRVTGRSGRDCCRLCARIAVFSFVPTQPGAWTCIKSRRSLLGPICGGRRWRRTLKPSSKSA